MKTSETKVLIYDQGILGVALGQALAKDFKTIYYFKPWMSAFPKPHEQWIGKGIPGITRVDSYEDVKAEILADDGIFFFPDVGDGDKQSELRSVGGRVFGAGDSGELEMNRNLFKEVLKDRGLNVPKYGVVVGTDELEKVLRRENDLWIKLDVEMRGVMETQYHGKWSTSRDWFYRLVYDLGCFRDITRFMWEKPWPGVEVGKETFLVNGENFNECLYGFELKGDGYIGKRTTLDDLPTPFKIIDRAMGPIEKKYRTSGAVSSELRVGDKGVYYVDPCRRFGNPPTASIIRMYKNLSKVVEGVVDGVEVEPEWSDNYVAELSVDVIRADEVSVPIELSEKDFDHIKLRAACKINDVYYNIPFKSVGTTIVKVVGSGPSREEAEFDVIKSAEHFAKDCCKGAYFNASTFERLEEELDKAVEFGINF